MRSYKILAIFLVISLVLLGCSEKNKEEPQSEETAFTSSLEENQTEESEALTLENDGINEEEFKEALGTFPDEMKEKIITSSVPISEILYELDITPVGIPTSQYELPEKFNDIPEIGTSMAPDIELITSLDADFFIGSASVKESLDEHLKNIALDTSYLGTDNFDDIKMAIKVLGTYFDKKDNMNAMLEDILLWENTLIEEGASLEKQKALLLIGMSDSFMVMNNNTYLGSILKRTNIENIAETEFKSEETYAAINMENIIQANPDVIFVLAYGDAEDIKKEFLNEIDKNEAWKSLAAYENDAIQFLDYDVYGVSSIKNMETALTGITEFLEVVETNE